MDAIKIVDFSKSYGNVLAVKNLNITITQGEIVGFVGKNGSGKSTTIRSIMNMIFQSSGTIQVLGLDSVNDAKELKKKIAYVPSEASFQNNITAHKLLKFCLQFTTYDDSKIQELAEYFELDLTKKISDLSLGNRKKVSLIQALLKESEIIILDEPTGGLDPLMQHKFFQLIIKEKEKGKTIFLSSHNLEEVEKYCDKVAIIKDGELVDYLDMATVSLTKRQTVSYKTRDGKKVDFDLEKDINEVIKELAKLDLTYLEIRTKAVTDEFIHYYKEDVK